MPTQSEVSARIFVISLFIVFVLCLGRVPETLDLFSSLQFLVSYKKIMKIICYNYFFFKSDILLIFVFNLVVSKPPYEIQETGWGEFEIIIKIFFVDPNERPVSIVE